MATKIAFLITICAILAVCFFHLWQLEKLPRGLYLDESSIGYNAVLISENGHDEHGKFMPIFFESFGEYKNPLYIYTTALLFKFLGVSDFTLRFTSFLFFVLFLVGIYFLSRDLFRNNIVVLFALLSAGFLPWFFALSRIAFEIVSQITIIIFALVFIYRAFHSKVHVFINSSVAGFFLGLSLYTYSTARLLTLLLLVSLFIVYFKFVKNMLVVVGSFLIVSLPYVYFSISNPGALTSRFEVVTYLYRPELSIGEKISTFLGNYFNYLSPNYLLWKGDTSVRHHPGASGELYLVVFILALVFVFFKIKQRTITRFQLLLAINLIFAPVAAALTTGDSSLRSILVGLYLLIFSFYGLSFLMARASGNLRVLILACVFLLLSFETAMYLRNYFTVYPKITEWAFESYGFDRALNSVYLRQPKTIIVSNTLDSTGIHYKFFLEKVMKDEGSIPTLIDAPVPSLESCVVFSAHDKSNLDLNPLEVTYSPESNAFIMLRCY